MRVLFLNVAELVKRNVFSRYFYEKALQIDLKFGIN
jgi:hypothetical protein